MRAFLVLFSASAAIVLCAGCESDVAPGTEVPGKLERGIRGEGTLYQPDRSNDPMIREESRVGG